MKTGGGFITFVFVHGTLHNAYYMNSSAFLRPRRRRPPPPPTAPSPLNPSPLAATIFRANRSSLGLAVASASAPPFAPPFACKGADGTDIRSARLRGGRLILSARLRGFAVAAAVVAAAVVFVVVAVAVALSDSDEVDDADEACGRWSGKSALGCCRGGNSVDGGPGRRKLSMAADERTVAPPAAAADTGADADDGPAAVAEVRCGNSSLTAFFSGNSSLALGGNSPLERERRSGNSSIGLRLLRLLLLLLLLGRAGPRGSRYRGGGAGERERERGRGGWERERGRSSYMSSAYSSWRRRAPSSRES